jgi:chaperone BCS1
MIEHHSQSLKIPDGQMRVFNVDYNSWNCAGNRTARCIDSVILPGNEMERITSDLEKFWKNAEWYHNMGIPHRRGWLLQGTPGSGKTSLISALAGRYKRGIHVLSLSEPNFSDAKLADLIARIPAGDMLLMEDVDAAFQQRESKDAGITFSGLLNALDGVSSPDGIVVFMTTNHPEKLDPALIRPGRIDQVMEFHTATDEQLTRLYERFNPSFDKDLFLEKTRGKTIAQAQVALLGHIA